MAEGPFYDYDLQAWIVEGYIAPCKHPEPQLGCYSCSHGGEEYQDLQHLRPELWEPEPEA